MLNIQTVIPFHLNEQWNIIPCTILPLVKLENVPPNDHEDDVGDVLQCLFFSPSALVNHLWSYAGNGHVADVDATYMQFFLGTTLPSCSILSPHDPD